MKKLCMEKQLRNSLSMSSSIFIAFLLLPIVSSANNHPLFIFGDSIFDAGNNNYINTIDLVQANFYPYGITFFHFPTGRNSDGRLICDFIAEHANLPLITPFLQPGETRFYDGVNFASTGAGALTETNQGLVIDLHTQLRNYKKVGSLFRDKFGVVEAKNRLSKAVYLFSVGANDYFVSLSPNSTFISAYTGVDYIDMVIGNITAVITEIYNAGGRKFSFLNVPRLGCAPLARILDANGDCMDELTSYATLHNKALVYVLKELKKQLPGFKYSLYDFYDNLQRRIDYPSHFGYKEGKTACCGTGKYNGIMSCGEKGTVEEFELCKNIHDYVFWDSVHLTERAYKQLADDMWNSRSHGSYSIKDLFHHA